MFNGLVRSTVIPPADANINTTVSTSNGLSEDAIDTLKEEGVGLQSGADDNGEHEVPDAPDGAMWALAASARARHAGGSTTVPGANLYNRTLFDAPSAITASNAISTAFLAQFRAARAVFSETQAGLELGMRTHTEWINERDSRTQGVFVAYSHICRGINRAQAMTGDDTEDLMAHLWAASLVYHWYVKCSMIVRCGVVGRVPAFDMRLLAASGALWFMVASYAPWLEQRWAFLNQPYLGGVFALGILRRLMASILDSSGVGFDICLVDILCNFPGLLLPTVLLRTSQLHLLTH